MKTFRLLTALTCTLPFSACATILYTPYQKVTANSDPQGANIFVNGIDTKKTTQSEITVKRKQIPLNGKLVVFTASSGNQSSLPYKEKQHGFFTYYLLKKLLKSKGDISYNELSKYLKGNVSLQSVLINNKEQSPQLNVSSSVKNEWENYNLK